MKPADWRSAERRALLEADWPSGRPTAEIAADMALLPGAPMPARLEAVQWWANDLGLRRKSARKALGHGLVETPGLKRALRLVEAGEPVLAIRAAVKLSVVEFQAVRRAAQEREAAQGRAGAGRRGEGNTQQGAAA